MALASNLPGPHRLMASPSQGFYARLVINIIAIGATRSAVFGLIGCSMEICRRPDWRLWCHLPFYLHDLDLGVEHRLYGTRVSPALLFQYRSRQRRTSLRVDRLDLFTHLFPHITDLMGRRQLPQCVSRTEGCSSFRHRHQHVVINE
ncbi:hypothetical protein CY34DRAFT_635578 [Suillus luteus UH-Slu-Lm8-n1]|uniref:Uncharacterized protein n=1 Tax=Suillus luteus UH-Slu-Lm8-n1 TaxID=930992 RepID=A0A0D0A8V4_9AGAM|nr:hypothetical protein CY34DRAFT_635578 [Suillus luteus UH-Slu-Lm8-n1]